MVKALVQFQVGVLVTVHFKAFVNSISKAPQFGFPNPRPIVMNIETSEDDAGNEQVVQKIDRDNIKDVNHDEIED